MAATRAVAQVKFKASQVGAPELQRLFGARGLATHQRLLFFTGTTYSAKALAYAAEHDVALFKFDLTGELASSNPLAARLLEAAYERWRQPAPSAAATPPAALKPPVNMPTTAAGTASAGGSEGSSGPITEVSAFASGIIAAGILCLPATLCLVGLGAAFVGAKHQGPAIALGIVGVIAYLVGLVGAAVASSGPRARWRWPLGLLAVALVTGPAIALWTALAISFSKDGDAPLVVLALMIAPIVLLGLVKGSPAAKSG